MKILYQTSATASGSGRDGIVAVDEGSFEATLATPKSLGGPGGEGTNPEQLFASGYAACFLSALRFVAGRRKVGFADGSTVTAQVGIGPRDDGAGFALDIALQVRLPELDRGVASELVAEAHANCPYSHLAREGLEVRLSLA